MSFTPEAARTLPSTTARPDSRTYTPEQNISRNTSVAIRLHDVRSAPVSWWLWWNVLSLDAPAVACTWSLLLLRSRGVTVHAADILALFFAVWLIYTSDRLLDSLKPKASPLQARHSFCGNHRVVFASLVLIFGPALLWLSVERLEAPTLGAGVILGVIVAFYLASIHAGPAGLSHLLPKEIAVGMIFAAGTSVPVWSRSGGLTPHSIVVSLLFGLLCSLNCLSIECWERPRFGGHWRRPSSAWISWADRHLSTLGLCVAIAAILAAVLSGSDHSSRIPLLVISFAALLTVILNARRESLSPEALRVLADAALLLPALAALALFY